MVGNGRLIMVTSSLPSEGKTFSAINLAISIAIGGEHPVLLIDADIARPSVSNTLQLDIPDEVGLTDYLEDPTIPISELLHETSVPGLSLMTAGHLNHRPVDLLASNNMAQLVERLKTMLPHHVIIFDTPPAAARHRDPLAVGPGGAGDAGGRCRRDAAQCRQRVVASA